MEVHVRNMVCARCMKSVTQIFRNAGLEPDQISLGLVRLGREPSPEQVSQVRQELIREGFEWLDDQKVKLTERIKKEILGLIQGEELDEMKMKLSSYLSSKLHKDYHHLSNIFSVVENTTIEQYFILQKIEKVKEWLVYGELNLNEMAYRLGYSSVAHLSGQFKKTTGFTPTQFKKLKDHNRKFLDKV